MVLPKSVVKPKFTLSETAGHVMPVHEYYSLFEVVSLIFDELSTTSNQTDLSITYNPSNIVVQSSSGNDATINAATTSLGGIMTSSDKGELDNLVDLAGVSGLATLGTFTGNIIDDNTTIKNALQQLETAVTSGGNSTNLSSTITNNTIQINSSTGDDVTLGAAVASDINGAGGSAGILRASDMKKLVDSITALDFPGEVPTTTSSVLTGMSKVMTYQTGTGVFGLWGAVGSANGGSNNIGLLTKPTLQTRLGIQNISTLTGVSENASNLGTFDQTIIPDNASIKSALQALENNITSSAPFVIGSVLISGGHTGKAIIKYNGTAPSITKNSSSIWTITSPAGCEIFSMDIYSPSADNPGANLTLNINTASTVYNQDLATIRVPMITGVNLTSIPGNYAPTTGAVNLLPRVNTTPSSGDIQIVINNFNNANALGTEATLLKLVF